MSLIAGQSPRVAGRMVTGGADVDEDMASSSRILAQTESRTPPRPPHRCAMERGKEGRSGAAARRRGGKRGEAAPLRDGEGERGEKRRRCAMERGKSLRKGLLPHFPLSMRSMERVGERSVRSGFLSARP